MDVINKFKEYIRKNKLIEKGDKILLALSGGGDSVFLFYMLKQLKIAGDISFEAFHLNHNLRNTALRDEQFCVRLCEKEKVKLHLYSRDIKKEAEEQKIGLEAAARRARYDISKDLIDAQRFSKLATAHHAADNAETVLMHLIRGCSVKGLSGIPPSSGKLIRPILCFSKEEIISYLDENHLEFMTDETNFCEDYFRNRVRHKLIPFLTTENPNIISELNSLSKDAGEYYSMAKELAEKVKLDIVEGKSVNVSFEQISKLPESVLYIVLSRMREALGLTCDFYRSAFEDVSALIKKGTNTVWSYSVQGMSFERNRDIFSSSIDSVNGKHEPIALARPIMVKPNSCMVFSAQRFSLELLTSENFKNFNSTKYIKALDYGKIKNSVFIRNREPGDSFMPLGMKNIKSLRRFFIDKKLTQSEKDRALIIADEENIAAVLPYEIDERYKLTEDTKKALILKYNFWE